MVIAQCSDCALQSMHNAITIPSRCAASLPRGKPPPPPVFAAFFAPPAALPASAPLPNLPRLPPSPPVDCSSARPRARLLIWVGPPEMTRARSFSPSVFSSCAGSTTTDPTPARAPPQPISCRARRPGPGTPYPCYPLRPVPPTFQQLDKSESRQTNKSESRQAHHRPVPAASFLPLPTGGRPHPHPAAREHLTRLNVPPPTTRAPAPGKSSTCPPERHPAWPARDDPSPPLTLAVGESPRTPPERHHPCRHSPAPHPPTPPSSPSVPCISPRLICPGPGTRSPAPPRCLSFSYPADPPRRVCWFIGHPARDDPSPRRHPASRTPSRPYPSCLPPFPVLAYNTTHKKTHPPNPRRPAA